METSASGNRLRVTKGFEASDSTRLRMWRWMQTAPGAGARTSKRCTSTSAGTLRHARKTDSPVSGSPDVNVNIMNPAADRNGKDLWAISCYFNPAAYRRRLANYRVFRERLSVPLVAVELAYHPNFELDEKDAEILVQLRGRDIMWQKERLLNVALQAVPSSCRKVAWLDCDVIFEADDWAERTSLLLDRFPMVQPFNQVYRMSGEWQPGRPPPAGSEL